MLGKKELLKLVETGSLLTSTLALTLLNQCTSGQILMIVSEFEQSRMGDTGGKVHAEG